MAGAEQCVGSTTWQAPWCSHPSGDPTDTCTAGPHVVQNGPQRLTQGSVQTGGVSVHHVHPCPCRMWSWLSRVGEGPGLCWWVAAETSSLPSALLYKPIDRVTRSTLVLHVSVTPVLGWGTLPHCSWGPTAMGSAAEGSPGWVLQAGQCPWPLTSACALPGPPQAHPS